MRIGSKIEIWQYVNLWEAPGAEWHHQYETRGNWRRKNSPESII